MLGAGATTTAGPPISTSKQRLTLQEDRDWERERCLKTHHLLLILFDDLFRVRHAWLSSRIQGKVEKARVRS